MTVASNAVITAVTVTGKTRRSEQVAKHGKHEYDVKSLLDPDRSNTSNKYSLKCEASDPMPAGSHNAMQLKGGAHLYSRTCTWLNVAEHYSFTVWGRAYRMPGRSPKYFNPFKDVRSRWGRGVVYTRWPVFDALGVVREYQWQIVRVEFELWKHPEEHDLLELRVNHHRGTSPASNRRNHELPTGELDCHWQELMRRAKQGFDLLWQPNYASN